MPAEQIMLYRLLIIMKNVTAKNILAFWAIQRPKASRSSFPHFGVFSIPYSPNTKLLTEKAFLDPRAQTPLDCYEEIS